MKARLEQVMRSLPCCSISRDEADATERLHVMEPQRLNSPVGSILGEDCPQVVRMNRVYSTRPKVQSLEGMAIGVISILVLDEESVLCDGVSGPQEDVEPKDRIFVLVASGGLTPILLSFEPYRVSKINAIGSNSDDAGHQSCQREHDVNCCALGWHSG